MKSRIVNGDVLKATESVIAHQTNCKGIMGAGVAKQIKSKYPEVFQGYLDFCMSSGYNGEYLLGWAQFVSSRDGKQFVNLFGQDGISEKDLNEAKHGRITNYEAFADALARLHTAMNNRGLKSVAMPYLIGCGLAKGNWNVVAAMIDAEFDNSDIDVVLYKFC